MYENVITETISEHPFRFNPHRPYSASINLESAKSSIFQKWLTDQTKTHWRIVTSDNRWEPKAEGTILELLRTFGKGIDFIKLADGEIFVFAHGESEIYRKTSDSTYARLNGGDSIEFNAEDYLKSYVNWVRV